MQNPIQLCCLPICLRVVRLSPLGAKRLGTAVRSYLGTLRWFSIPASVGFAYVCYQQFWHIKEREKRKLKSGESSEPSQWQVRLRDLYIASRNIPISLFDVWFLCRFLKEGIFAFRLPCSRSFQQEHVLALGASSAIWICHCGYVNQSLEHFPGIFHAMLPKQLKKKL